MGRAQLGHVIAAAGSPSTAKAAIEAFVERTGADELMIASQIFDHQIRLRSYELLAGLFDQDAPAETAAASA